MTSQFPSSQDQLTFPWQNSERPIEKRVELLVAETSLEEKVAQLSSRWVGNDSPESGGALTHTGRPPRLSSGTGAPHPCGGLRTFAVGWGSALPGRPGTADRADSRRGQSPYGCDGNNA